MVEKQVPPSATPERTSALENLKGRYLQFRGNPTTLLHVHFTTQQDTEMREFLVVDKNPEDAAHPYRIHFGLVPRKDIVLSQARQSMVLFPKDTCNIATVIFGADFKPRDVAISQEYGDFSVQQASHCPLAAARKQFGKAVQTVLEAKQDSADPNALKVLQEFLG
ncbi:MAG: hypothetical protein ABH851_00855 [Methanobacteriota archaeon]